MRNWTLASLVLIGGGLSIAACNSGTGDSADADGVGATTNTGGGSNLGGAGNTGGGSSSGGSSTTPAGCGTVVTATGAPGMIDDFEGREGSTASLGMGGAALTEWAAVPANDGRAGQWAHGHFLNKASNPEAGEIGQYEVSEGALRFWCEEGAAPEHAQCNTEWDSSPAKRWEQYAALETLLQPYVDPASGDPSCYDATTYTGIRFKARSNSASGDKLRVQFVTPDADAESGWTYQSPESNIPAGASWTDIEIPFENIKMPSWVAAEAMAASKPVPPTAINTKALISLSIVVRSATPQTEGTIMGETLNPYDIEIDDIQFY